MILSVISICISALTAITATTMPVIQTAIKNRHELKLKKFDFVVQEQSAIYHAVMETFIDYVADKYEANAKELSFALSKAAPFAKDEISQKRYKDVFDMLTHRTELAEEAFNRKINAIIKDLQQVLSCGMKQ